MNFKLLSHDRLCWAIIATLYAALGITAVVLGGPISWNVRGSTGAGAGIAAVEVGLGSGLLLAGAVFAAVATGRPSRPIIPWSVPLLGLAATGLGVSLLTPAWWGLLPLLPAALSVVGLLARRESIKYSKQFDADSDAPMPDSVDPTRLVKRSEPDTFLTFGGAGLLMAAGAVAVVASATVAPWFKPALPAELQADGQVTVGEGNPVSVELLYGYNYPTTGILLGDEDDSVLGLVDEGVAELTTQGVSLPDATALAVPILQAQACAWDTEGSEGALDVTAKYHQEFLAGDLSDNVSDILARTVEGMGADFESCLDSGKYEYSAGKELQESSSIAEQGFPQIYVNGESVQPESAEELAQLIRDAQ